MFGWGTSKASRNSQHAKASSAVQLPSTLRGNLVHAVNEGAGMSMLKRSSTSELENVGEVLGEGNFGVVKLRRDKNTGEPRAVKTVIKPDHWDRARLIREAEVMQNLDHPHILRLFAWHECEDSVVMVTEFCAGGEIIKAVDKAKREGIALHQGWAAMVFQQLFEAASYIHDRGLVHRDIKSGNLLLMRAPESPMHLFKTTPHAVVVDLGLAEIFGLSVRSTFALPSRTKKGLGDVKGTAGTMAPEVWRGSSGPKADIWSIGCVFYEMYADRLPYMPGDPQDSRAETWMKLHSTTNVDWSPMLTNSGEEAKDLCRQLLNTCEKERPCAKECLKHAWFRKFISSCPKDACSQISDLPTLCKAMCQWQNLKPMHRAVCLKLASESSGTSKFAVIFSQIDTDNNGILTQAELTEALHNFGVDVILAAQVADALDYNRDGSCEYLEFAAACLSSLGTEYDEMLWQEFCLLDLSGTGRLNTSSFSRLLEKLKPLCVSHSLQFPQLDTDGDGHIDWYEFASVFGRPGVDYSTLRYGKADVLQRLQTASGSPGRDARAGAAVVHSPHQVAQQSVIDAGRGTTGGRVRSKSPPGKTEATPLLKKRIAGMAERMPAPSPSAASATATPPSKLAAPAKCAAPRSGKDGASSGGGSGGGGAGAAAAATNGSARKAKVIIVSRTSDNFESCRPHRQRRSRIVSGDETGVPSTYPISESRLPEVPPSTITPSFLKGWK